MYELSLLIEKLTPSQTALLLGAGASIPSGAPSGKRLGQLLAARGGIGNAESYDLSAICSLYEHKHGRKALAEAVRSLLVDLRPTGGLQLMPSFDWFRIYSTNFDTLVEQVYANASRSLSVKRSNFDFSRTQPTPTTELYKIHGCITQDVGFGNQSRMLLTEDDYESYVDFQQASFRALETDVLTKDILVVGQSLADPHLKTMVRQALKIQRKFGTSGRIFVLARDRDEALASLTSAQGAEVFFGDLDELFYNLVAELPMDDDQYGDSSLAPNMLPHELLSVTTDVRHSLSLDPNAKLVFNGSPGTYADISAGYTFSRTEEPKVIAGLGKRPVAILLGAGGVGKTTLSRRVLLSLRSEVDHLWEHNNSFPLLSEYWIEYESRLRSQGLSAVLLVDDCVDYLPQVGRIAEHLGKTESPALRLILTATTGKWKQRTKPRYIFSHGHAYTLSRLSNADIDSLLSLTRSTPQIKDLVDSSFIGLARGEQERILRERCSADMYVCMKNIFAAENLDYILLREFNELDEPAQDIYRVVAALEALGAKVHRQLVMRLLNMEAGTLQAILEGLTGVIREFDIRPRDGLFGWETRHRQIATTIARYKYAEQDELVRLFEDLIEGINPSIRQEVDTAKSLCSEEFGIDRLIDPTKQVDMLRRVVTALPGERTPRHRLVRRLIDQDRLPEAREELTKAKVAVRETSVLARYEVLIMLRESEQTVGIMEEDRVAILLTAYAKAVRVIRTWTEDMHGYQMLGEVAYQLARRRRDLSELREAHELTKRAEDWIFDAEMVDIRTRMEGRLRTLEASFAS